MRHSPINQSLCIGHTYDQCVSIRLAQPDHTHRYTDFVKDYPRHSFWVSCGIITMTNSKRTRKRVQDIETLLIHTNRSEHFYNVRNVSEHSVTDAYHIQNYGYRYDLPRELHLGLFVL